MLKKNVMLQLMSDITVYISICDFRTESSINVKVSMFFWPKKIIFFPTAMFAIHILILLKK